MGIYGGEDGWRLSRDGRDGYLGRCVVCGGGLYFVFCKLFVVYYVWFVKGVTVCVCVGVIRW